MIRVGIIGRGRLCGRRDADPRVRDRLAHSFIGATRSLLDVIATGGDPILTPAKGRDMLAASLAAQRSAQTGSVPDVAAPTGRLSEAVRSALLESAQASSGHEPG